MFWDAKAVLYHSYRHLLSYHWHSLFTPHLLLLLAQIFEPLAFMLGLALASRGAWLALAAARERDRVASETAMAISTGVHEALILALQDPAVILALRNQDHSQAPAHAPAAEQLLLGSPRLPPPAPQFQAA